MINIFTDIEQFDLAKYIIHNYNTQNSDPKLL